MESREINNARNIEKLKSPDVINRDMEKIDTSIDGQNISKADQIVIMAHGFGTDKHERGIFDQITETLINDNNRQSVVRFSYAGFGDSEGDQKTKTLDTMSDDLISVMDYVKNTMKPDCKVTFIGFSLGTTVVAKAFTNYTPIKPDRIIIINPSEFNIRTNLQDYFKARPETTVDEAGVWHLKRSDGSITYIGDQFWQSIDIPDELEHNLTNLAANNNTVLIRAMDDDVVDISNPLTDIPFAEVIKLRGDHNYSKPEDRIKLLEAIRNTVIADE